MKTTQTNRKKRWIQMNSENSEIKNNPEKVSPNDVGKLDHKNLYIQRFDPFLRFLHLLVIISFISLAITGMTIKFSDVGIFQFISQFLGGYEVTGFIHRFAAIITFYYFFAQLYYLAKKKKRKEASLKELLSGENSLVPNKNDVVEFWQTMKWFLGFGKRPNYGRWTYWEKFDYFAVFWGVAVIGSSGLMLWFPEFFTFIGLPGWFINVAGIIHSDEALLATGFIFSVHFFNSHFRPEKFPMDPVIFTGKITIEELKNDRPRQYKLLVESGELEKMIVPPPTENLKRAAHIFGITAFLFGFITLLLILYTVIFVYN
ncbi:MAG: cytochrome b/b6 domain-containing protein [bacterium]